MKNVYSIRFPAALILASLPLLVPFAAVAVEVTGPEWDPLVSDWVKKTTTHVRLYPLYYRAYCFYSKCMYYPIYPSTYFAVEKPPTILFRHQLGPIAQSNDGRLIVYPGTILHMECLWIRRFGTPKWEVSHSYRYPTLTRTFFLLLRVGRINKSSFIVYEERTIKNRVCGRVTIYRRML